MGSIPLSDLPFEVLSSLPGDLLALCALDVAQSSPELWADARGFDFDTLEAQTRQTVLSVLRDCWYLSHLLHLSNWSPPVVQDVAVCDAIRVALAKPARSHLSDDNDISREGVVRGDSSSSQAPTIEAVSASSTVLSDSRGSPTTSVSAAGTPASAQSSGQSGRQSGVRFASTPQASSEDAEDATEIVLDPRLRRLALSPRAVQPDVPVAGPELPDPVAHPYFGVSETTWGDMSDDQFRAMATIKFGHMLPPECIEFVDSSFPPGYTTWNTLDLVKALQKKETPDVKQRAILASLKQFNVPELKAGLPTAKVPRERELYAQAQTPNAALRLLYTCSYFWSHPESSPIADDLRDECFHLACVTLEEAVVRINAQRALLLLADQRARLLQVSASEAIHAPALAEQFQAIDTWFTRLQKSTAGAEDSRRGGRARRGGRGGGNHHNGNSSNSNNNYNSNNNNSSRNNGSGNRSRSNGRSRGSSRSRRSSNSNSNQSSRTTRNTSSRNSSRSPGRNNNNNNKNASSSRSGRSRGRSPSPRD